MLGQGLVLVQLRLLQLCLVVLARVGVSALRENMLGVSINFSLLASPSPDALCSTLALASGR